MSQVELRAARKQDIDSICRIWQLCFGDSSELVEKLLLSCGLLKSTTVASLNGQPRSFICSFDGLKLNNHNCSYLYALGTDPESRGMGLGSMVTQKTIEIAFEQGAEFVCLRPSDEGLEKWYKERFSMEAVCHYEKIAVAPDISSSFDAEPISPEEYLQLRKSSALLSLQLIKAQDVLCTHYGGGLFRLSCGDNSFCACCETDDTGLFIRELDCHDELLSQAAGTLCKCFGTKNTSLQRRASSMHGRSTLLALGKGKIPPTGLYLPMVLD